MIYNENMWSLDGNNLTSVALFNTPDDNWFHYIREHLKEETERNLQSTHIIYYTKDDEESSIDTDTDDENY